MNAFKKSTFAAAVMLASMVPAQAADVEVIHWWTSGGEQAAVSVFADEFDKLGGDKWVDTAIAGGDASRSTTMQRILGGDPPEAAQFNNSRQFEELVEAGLLVDLSALAEKEGWKSFMRPASILDTCTKDGKIYCVPVNIHSWQWAWASTEAYKKAGVELPKNIDEFIATAPKLQAAGITPLAVGGQSWQVSGMFRVLFLNILGRDIYEAVYKDRNLELAGGADVKTVFEKFRTLKKFTDEASANRNWNDTTNLVIQHKAGMQIMGDWARGEFSLAGKKAGVDYECIAGPSETPHLSTGGDIFLFPKQDDAAVEAAQLKLASMMVNPKVQAVFNLAKGSLPIRDDVDLSLADSCMKKGIELLKNPKTVVGDPEAWISADSWGQVKDLFAEFWADDSMSVDAAQAKFVQILEDAS